MLTLFETYKKVLAEAVAQSRFITAIENHFLVKFYYEGDEDERRGWREGEIYALGESTAGNKVIRVYQTKGVTKTRIPEWKLFRLDKIKTLYFVGEFDTPRDKFNSNGDNSMVKVFNLANFN